MGRGFAEAGTPRADVHLGVMRHAMGELRQDPGDYNRYRLEIEYPLMFVRMQVWFELEGQRRAWSVEDGVVKGCGEDPPGLGE